MADRIIKKGGNYKSLLVFQKSECIYDITCYFTGKYLSKGDRTVDQMVQAARSGKQNIAEGSAAAATSAETEIKLTNVAKASLQELLLDYEDFLRKRGMEQWSTDSEKYEMTRAACRKHSDSAYFRYAISRRNEETIANIAITLIHQTDFLLERLIESQERRFLKEGGFKEKMYRARLDARRGDGRPGSAGSAEKPESAGSAEKPGSTGSAEKPGSTGSAEKPGSAGSAGKPESAESAGKPGSTD